MKLKNVIRDYAKMQFMKPEMKQFEEEKKISEIFLVWTSVPQHQLFHSTDPLLLALTVCQCRYHLVTKEIWECQLRMRFQYFYWICRLEDAPSIQLNPRKCCFSFLNFKSKQPIQILSFFHSLSFFCQVIFHLAPNGKTISLVFYSNVSNTTAKKICHHFIPKPSLET